VFGAMSGQAKTAAGGGLRDADLGRKPQGAFLFSMPELKPPQR